MLKRIRLVDFKSFVDEQVELAPLTLLVGANASGKSNLLDAIRFLKGLTLDLTLNEILNGEKRSQADAWPGIRGRAEEAARIGTSAFQIDSTWLASVPFDRSRQAAEADSQRVEIHHTIHCGGAPQFRLDAESLDGGKLLGAANHSGGSRSLLGILANGSLIPEALDRGVAPVIPVLRDILRDVQFLEINPARMRDYGRRGDPLGEDGRNMSGVLSELCANPDEKFSLVSFIAELCAPEIEDIEFRGVEELGDVIAMFVEKNGRRISARSISDGTLHFLGTLLALRTAKPGSVVLIEEIESGLHPTRIRLLVEYLQSVTNELDIQVIATTHSPVVLQWLSEESLRNTIVCGRVPEHEGTILRRLSELPHLFEVLQRKGIDELFTTGWLEMAL